MNISFMVKSSNRIMVSSSFSLYYFKNKQNSKYVSFVKAWKNAKKISDEHHIDKPKFSLDLDNTNKLKIIMLLIVIIKIIN